MGFSFDIVLISSIHSAVTYVTDYKMQPLENDITSPGTEVSMANGDADSSIVLGIENLDL